MSGEGYFDVFADPLHALLNDQSYTFGDRERLVEVCAAFMPSFAPHELVSAFDGVLNTPLTTLSGDDLGGRFARGKRRSICSLPMGSLRIRNLNLPERGVWVVQRPEYGYRGCRVRRLISQDGTGPLDELKHAALIEDLELCW